MGEGCAWARVIPFGWADLAIVNGAPQARRNFLDGFVAKIYPCVLRRLIGDTDRFSRAATISSRLRVGAVRVSIHGMTNSFLSAWKSCRGVDMASWH